MVPALQRRAWVDRALLAKSDAEPVEGIAALEESCAIVIVLIQFWLVLGSGPSSSWERFGSADLEIQAECDKRSLLYFGLEKIMQ